ncbi:MAG: SDR family NAD(P)-dependent oxidoreductase [Polyangiales bacterium]
MTEIRGRLALVTGGGRGVGRLLARELAAKGARIVLLDVLEKELEESARELRAGGATVFPYVLDVTRPEAIQALRERVHADAGRVEILVNNAGVVFGGAFLDVPLERHLLTYAVNTLGVVAMTHAFLPDLVASRAGHLVNVASASGLVGLPFGATYSSSKWAVIGFSESIRYELAEQGKQHVVVTTVCPSYINSGMFEGAKPPLLTPILEPEDLVRQVIAGIEHDEAVILAPAMVKLVPFLKGVLPLPVLDRVAQLLGLNTSMMGWKGHSGRKPV